MKRLIFVDDTPIVIKGIMIFLKEYIQNQTLEILTYTDSTELLEALQQQTLEYDILFVDINMPKLDGYELAKAVRTIEKYKYKPIIALTTEISNEAKLKAKQSGIVNWITKISSPDAMRNAILSMIERY